MINNITCNIKEICKEYGIINYTINPDGSIDVDGNVALNKLNLTKLPLKFNKVIGSFYCNSSQLTSLDGCPNYVGGWFDCNTNKLTSLEGAPTYVGNSFYCQVNILTSLEGCPNYIGGYFICSGNPLLQEIIDNPKAELTRLNREKKLNTLLNSF